MGKLLKYLVFLVAGLAFFAVVLIFILFAVIDPNRYKPAIESAVAQQTGMQLRIAGDIDWTFRPVFGLSINDVRLSNGVTPQELASFSSIALKLAPRGLLSGNLEIQEFNAENLHVNWFVDADGQANWLVNAEAPPANPAQGSTSNEIPVDINIAEIVIRNASIAIRDQQQGLDTRLQNIDLNSRNTNLDNRPFPLELSMRIVDQLSARDLTLNLETTAAVDFNAGNITLRDMNFNLSPLVLSGDMQVNDFRNAMRWRTSLSSNTFNLSHLLSNFIDMDEATMPGPNEQQFTIRDLQANGDASGITLAALTMALDNTSAELRGDYLFPTDDRLGMLAYRLSTGAINLDDLLPPSPEQVADEAVQTEGENISQAPAAAAQAAAQSTELPIELLRSMNIRGEHSIASLAVSGLEFSPLEFGLVLQDGNLSIDTQPIGFYDGELDATIALNANSSPSQLSVETSLTGVNASALTADMPRLDFFTGRFDASTNHTMRGNTVEALIDSINGASRLQVNDSSVDVTMLKRVFSAISVLSPRGDMTAQWPDVVRFTNTEAYLIFNEGIGENQELNVRLDNFDIAGTGGIDLDAGEFDYRLNFTVLGEPAPQTIRVNADYQNVAWPVRCDAAFDAAPAQYCSPDLQRVREVFTAIARDEVERRASEAVGEQVERLRNRIRNLFEN